MVDGTYKCIVVNYMKCCMFWFMNELPESSDDHIELLHKALLSFP